jgi:prepilin peptidase CpaA
MALLFLLGIAGLAYSKQRGFAMIDVLLCCVLLLSLITDLRSRKILNVVTFPTMGLGLLLHTVSSGWGGLTFGVLGLLVGSSLLLVPYLMGGMGAGDVKLLAAVGALKGAGFVFYAGIYTAIVGGVIGAAYLVWKRKLFLFTIIKKFTGIPGIQAGEVQLRDYTGEPITFPYGLAIVTGTLLAYLLGGLR